ncbi:MAG: type II toxin-antitoxin system HicA family toxin [Desulfotomaculum sp.]|nr:type II toxin-antitoxin system HicA family toxin [Desulfotomaculum sp.]MCL0081510.1 type II toxin-antitoxin system HicA family toxin [Peptococcaceae bacterium]
MKSYSSKELIKIIKKDGWKECRNPRGSHYYFKHSVKKGLVTIPHPRKNIPIKTAKSILMQAGLKGK